MKGKLLVAILFSALVTTVDAQVYRWIDPVTGRLITSPRKPDHLPIKSIDDKSSQQFIHVIIDEESEIVRQKKAEHQARKNRSQRAFQEKLQYCEEQVRNTKAPSESSIKRRIGERMRDPDSVQIRNIRKQNWGYVLEYNAKNAFGAYVGFKSIMIFGEKIIWNDEDLAKFKTDYPCFRI